MTGLGIALGASALGAFALAVRVVAGEKRSIPTCAFAAGLVLFGADALLAAAALEAADLASLLQYWAWRFFVLALLPGAWLCFAVTYARGNYRAFARRWVPAVATLLVVVPAVALWFQNELLLPEEAGLRLGLPARVVHMAVILGATAALVSIERTFRASVGIARWKLKFIIVGVASLLLTRIYTSTQALVFSRAIPSLESFHAAALAICALLGFVSLRRARGFMLDLYPSPTLVYRSLALLLVGGYLVAVGFFAKVIGYFGGAKAFPAQAFLLLIALVGLGLLTVSDRLRLASKRFVARYLRRPLYDVRKVWMTFSEATAGHAEENELCRATVKWLAETFDALSVTIWLLRNDAMAVRAAHDAPTGSGTGEGARRAAPARPVERELFFGGSTCLPENEAEPFIAAMRSPGRPTDEVSLDAALARLEQVGAPVNIDASAEPALESFRRLQPPRFPHGGQRLCIPILNAGTLIGFVLVGDRVAGVLFSEEEIDLLKCVINHVSGEIVRIRLARRVAENREMQAFQTMATFFVHDLKNTAWTLSLLVENLKLHFDDPSFREEAVRAVTKSVTRINDLVGRIGSLRHQLELKPEAVNVSDLVQRALKEFEGMKDVRLIASIDDAPIIEADREQIHKVLVNLVLNAKEACTAGGEIRVTCKQRNGHVGISVEDNGSGMSVAFQKERLFKPFQTTKKKGIGIGMFQSKTIVEAHRGKIMVNSEEGRGTRVEIILPVKGNE